MTPRLPIAYEAPTEPAPGPGPYGAGFQTLADDGAYGSEAGIDVRRYIAALWRFKWLILLVTVVGTALGVVASKMIRPEYEAQATIWIERSGDSRSRSSQVGPVLQSGLLEDKAWGELLRSYRVLDTVAVRLQLYLKTSPAAAEVLSSFRLKEKFLPGAYRLTVSNSGEAYTLATSRGQVLERGSPGDSIGSTLGFEWAPPAEALWPGRTIEFNLDSPRDASNRLLGTLRSQMDKEADFLRLTLRGSDPNRVAGIVNAVADRYIEVAADLKSAKLRVLANILDEQLQHALRNLQQAESALEGFRVETITLPSEQAVPVNPGLELTTSPAISSFLQLKTEQDQLSRDRSEIGRVLSQAADSGLSVEALELVPSVQAASDVRAAISELIDKRANLRALRYAYTDRHPDVLKANEEIATLERRTIPLLLRRLINDLDVREKDIDGLIGSAATQLKEIPARAIEEARRQRQVQIQADLYTRLQAGYEQARLAAVTAIPDVRLLDPAAVPRRPVDQQKRLRLILMAFMGSFGLAVVGALLLDRFDPNIKYPDQVSRDLGLPILGTIPHVKGQHGRGALGNISEVVESFRLIRLNLFQTYGAAGPVVIAITSSAEEEGKSFVTSNLALAFADLGRRTLAIDGDVRRGRLHQLLGGTRKPGLTDYLAGRVPLHQLLQPTGFRGLDRISSGTRLRAGPELLQSSAMAELVAELRSRYDVILLDTPPIGVGADALALATLTGNVLMVVRTGATNREMSETKLDMLERMPVRLLGAVLNDVPDQRAYRSYKYSYSYLPGYEAVDEEDWELDARLIEADSKPVDRDDVLTPEPPASSPSDNDGGAVLEVRATEVRATEVRPAANPRNLPEEKPAEPEENPNGQPGPAIGSNPQRELHRQHQRRSQVRQWR